MEPPVPVPGSAGVPRPVELKLKRGWRYDAARGVFVSGSGREFVPESLPAASRLEYKVPALARAARAGLSPAERDLQRYMQVVLPRTRSLGACLKAVRAWPCVEEAHVAPAVSLPLDAPRRKR